MKALKVLLALVVIIVVVACAAKPGEELTGNWQKEDGSVTIAFTKDGKLNLAGGPAAVSAAFKVQDKETLRVDLGIFGTATLKYSLAKDALTITDAKGEASKYTRVKEVKGATEAKKPEAPKAQPETPQARPAAAKTQPEAPAMAK
ncbi:MAG: hypothetical protein WAW37_12915 [Syntrophobacteraceae bacterium]